MVDISSTYYTRYNYMFRRLTMAILRLYMKDLVFFYILLTVHLSIFISVINPLDAQNLFYSKFISCLYMFRALCAHHQANIVLYNLWYHHTY